MLYLNKVKSTLQQLKPELSAKYGVDLLGLFGSIVRDDFTEESDIDIIVSFNRPIGIDFIAMADELEEILGRKVDLVSKNEIKPQYAQEIESEIVYV